MNEDSGMLGSASKPPRRGASGGGGRRAGFMTVTAALRRSCALLAAVCLLLSLEGAQALEVPRLAARVNDEAGLLPPEARQRLEQKLAAHERATGHQLVLLTLVTLAGEPIENFAVRVFESWKLGKKATDDGLLLLVARDDRKVRIEVGYGLEGDVTDAVSSRVIRQVISPAFRQGDYAGGIERAFDRLMEVTGGIPAGSEPAPQPAARRRGAAPSWLHLLLLGLFLLGPLLLSLFSGGGRGRGGRGGGGVGSLLAGALTGSLLSGRGGGGFGGGGFGGGGFGGGGGGGFSGGGGSSGGGGASGSW